MSQAPGGAGGQHDRILDEAAKLFIRFGYHGISMRQIAEAVGISKAGLYHHFADKQSLFLAILLRNIERVGDLVDEARAQGGSTREVVARLVNALLVGMVGGQRFIRLAEQDASSLDPDARDTVRSVYRQRFIDPISAVLQGGVTRGELRGVEPETATWLLLGLTLAGLSTPPERASAMATEIVRLFFEGVGAR